MLSLRAAYRSERTNEFYETNLRRFLWWLRKGDYPEKIAGIGAPHIRLFLTYLQENKHRWGSKDLQSNKPLSDTSVQAYFRVLRAFFNWAAREDYVPASPFEGKRILSPKTKQRLIPSYTLDELKEIIDSCKSYGNPHRLRDLAIIYLLLDTGVRASELCDARIEDLERGRLKVTGKGNRERYLALSPETEKALRDYVRRERREGGDTLFYGKGTEALTRSGLYQMIERQCQRAGVLNPGVHKFRHTFALLFSKSGGPLQALQTLLGHSSPAMSMKYGRMASDEAAQLHRQHSPVERLAKRKK